MPFGVCCCAFCKPIESNPGLKISQVLNLKKTELKSKFFLMLISFVLL